MRIAIIGGGPSGLRAAEVAAGAWAGAGGIVTPGAVTLFDAKPSIGRKFLVAGRGGLNLTHDEPRETFLKRYGDSGEPVGFWQSVLSEFGPDDLRAWASGLGVETFGASTGRVYPKEMKSAPLLRRWRMRLGEMGVRFAMNHRWIGLRGGPPWKLDFQTPEARTETVASFEADAVILALGGASWPETGSDGGWRSILEERGVKVAPFRASNCGWELDWPPAVIEKAEGRPLKNISASAGGLPVMGELMVTRYGIEGGIIYQLGPELRSMADPRLVIDFKPATTVERLIARLGQPGRNLFSEAIKRWRIDSAAAAILEHHAENALWSTPQTLASAVKSCAIRLRNPRPIAEAISSAGGVEWTELTEDLMIRKLPGVFVAGEMIDWDAPTGGYLMQGCFSTGTRAARGTLGWLTS